MLISTAMQKSSSLDAANKFDMGLPMKRQNTGNSTGSYFNSTNGQSLANQQIGAAHDRKQTKMYVLTVLKDGEYQELTPAEMENFIEDYPEIAQYWQKPESLEKLHMPKDDNILYEHWD